VLTTVGREDKMIHLRTLAGIAILAVALVGASQAAAGGKNGAGVAPLSGETLLASEIPPVGTSTVSGTCNPLANSTFDFTVTGQASGPYPGTFTESGTFTIGPATSVALVSFDSTFTITSPQGTVTGTKSFTGPLNFGACGLLAFPPPASPNAHSLQATLSYTAQITTPTGSGSDSGTSVVTYQDTRVRGLMGFNGFSFDENFTSTTTPPCDDDDDGDNGDDCDEDED
jgi:hypothetical protein